MSTVEDRLTAALAARAELVRSEDLRYAEPPTAPPSRVPRVATYTVAVAACAAAIAGPFVFGGGPGPSELEPAPSPAPVPTPNGAEVPGAAWPVAYTFESGYDVDGDGEPDEVVIRTKGEEDLPPGPRRLEVNLSSGGQAAVILDYDTFDLTLIEPVELDAGAGDEILYYRGTVDDGRDIGVVDLVGGALVDLTVPDDPGLTATATEREGWRARHYWVRDRSLYTMRTVEGGFVPGASSAPTEPPYDVQVWQWRITDGALQALPEAQQCWDPVKSDRPYPCASGGPVGLPTERDEAVGSIGSAEYFEADVNGDGADDVVALEGPADIDDGQVEEGEVMLVVSLGGGGELTAAVPAGWAPDVLEQPVLLEEGPGLLLRQEGGDATPMVLHLLRDGELVEAEVAVNEAVRFGNGVDGEGSVYSSTFVTRNGELWTRVGDTTDPEDAWRFHRWTLDGTTLFPDRNGDLGCWEC